MTSIGVDLLVWMHAARRLKAVPQSTFLERFEPSRRWVNGATPEFGLARAAVLYHLPLAPDLPTAAEWFQETPFARRICSAEREWLECERRARFSYFEVVSADGRQVVLRDWFGSLSGRADVVIAAEELDETDLAVGETVFTRLVRYREAHYVDLLQVDSTLRAGLAEPQLPAALVWASPAAQLRDRAYMVNALFDIWTRETAHR